MPGTVHRVPAAVATVTLQRILVGLRGADPLGAWVSNTRFGVLGLVG